MSHRNAQPAFTLIELLAVIAIIGILIALLLPAVQAARESARRLQCGSQLSQVGIAIKHYEQAHGVLPMGTTNETGPIRNVPIGNHMGWIPRILPYMEQTPLYESIDFHKSVYDPANQPAWVGAKPRILGCPSDGNYGSQNSSYMACSGGTETPINIDNNGVFFLNSKLRSRDIPDGTSNTIWVGEAPIFNNISRDNDYRKTKYILPEPGENEDDIEETDDTFFSYYDAGSYVYGGLGWMSGTPGTIRNTGNPLNTFVGPFSNWPMPFQGESYRSAGLNLDTFPWSEEARQGNSQYGEDMMGYDFMYDNTLVSTDESAEFDPMELDEKDEAAEQIVPPDPAKIWAKELPGQYKVGGYGSYHTGCVNFLFGDGSMRNISKMVDQSVLQNMGNRADGQIIDGSL